ncbi:MAG TPA: outer membrane lipoprotein carrier protein LolA [Desulfobacterales bacterium]|nr:outer membrane lipoprotein carrier protein LolA [Desulfobacterales bacterium]
MIRCFFICILLFGALRGPCWGLEVADILDRVQQRYAAGGFEADFVQESHLKAMGMVDTAKGHLYLGRPGMMRWHYRIPEEYLLIADGVTVWIYRPEENQVMVGRSVDYFGGGADFFSKPGELSKEFIVERAPQKLQEKDHYVLRLVPRTERPSLAQLYLFISKETFDVAKSVSSNVFGDETTLRFERYRFDQALDPSLFVFDIPNGAEVVQLQDNE